MLCLLAPEELCKYGGCRYYIGGMCVLENIDREGWPNKNCRAKNPKTSIIDNSEKVDGEEDKKRNKY